MMKKPKPMAETAPLPPPPPPPPPAPVPVGVGDYDTLVAQVGGRARKAALSRHKTLLEGYGAVSDRDQPAPARTTTATVLG